LRRGSNVGLLTTHRVHQFGTAQLLHAPPARPIRGLRYAPHQGNLGGCGFLHEKEEVYYAVV
jgi:hypothetical protein